MEPERSETYGEKDISQNITFEVGMYFSFVKNESQNLIYEYMI